MFVFLLSPQFQVSHRVCHRWVLCPVAGFSQLPPRVVMVTVGCHEPQCHPFCCRGDAYGDEQWWAVSPPPEPVPQDGGCGAKGNLPDQECAEQGGDQQ